jgi:hypothetical protein
LFQESRLADGMGREDDGSRTKRDDLAQTKTGAHTVGSRLGSSVMRDGTAARWGAEDERLSIEVRTIEQRDPERKMWNVNTGDRHVPLLADNSF